MYLVVTLFNALDFSMLEIHPKNVLLRLAIFKSHIATDKLHFFGNFEKNVFLRQPLIAKKK